MDNIHATAIDINNAGVLILGKSASGKSDLALRLIENKQAVLVSDDRTNLSLENNLLIASAPQKIAGLLEVRGIGIIKVDFKHKTTIKLAVELCPSQEIERLPQQHFFCFKNIQIPLLKLNPFECSAIDKVVIKLKAVLETKK